MVVFLIRAYYTLIVYLCQEHCGANCGRIFASLRKGGIRAYAMASQRSFRVSYITTEKQKKEAMNASFLFLERITRLARLAFALADTHPTDEQSPGLFFASQRSFRVSYTTTKEQKKKKYKTSSFFVYGADYETRTRYLHLGKVTLYRMS